MNVRRVLLAMACATAAVGGLAGSSSARRVPCLDRVAACARLSVDGVPERCASERFVARVRMPAYGRFDRIVVDLDGRVVRRSRKHDFNVSVRCAELRAGAHRIEAVARPGGRTQYGFDRVDFTVSR